MYTFMRKKHLPVPSGQFAASCVDLMTDYSQEGIFVRLHYPTALLKQQQNLEEWIPWIPHDKYIQGLAIVVGIWVFLVRIAMWWYGGKMHIPAVFEAELLPKHERKGKKLPVVIFSHGFGASRFISSSLFTELASQGYVVASLEHRDSSACATYYYESAAHRDRDERTWIPHRRVQFGAQHYALRNKQVKYRRNECVKALELLEKINEGKPSGNVLKISFDLHSFEGQLDLERVTVMGHSFGGATALLAVKSDSRFKQGIILDGWMFPLKEENLDILQPLLFINSHTFHIPSNLTAMDKVIREPQGAHRQHCFIKNSTHETQTDSPFVFGYWFDMFKPKIDPTLGNTINNCLILKFLQNYTGTPENKERVESDIQQYQSMVVDSLPPPVAVRKGFFDLLLPH